MLQGEHYAILSTFIKLPFVIKIFVLCILEWPFYTGFSVFIGFSDVNVRVNGRTPLLMFCDALMSSVSMEHTKPDQKLSLECVQCTLKENRLDLLAHWIAQNRFVAFQVGFSFT